MRQLLEAVAHCHDGSVVHRDIKLEHLMLHRCNLSNEVNAVLVDLGIGTIVKADGLQERYGSPEYMAPEVILGNYGTKADVWSSGVVLYAMLSGYLPYQAETSSQ